jgi:hypothetical protein
VPSDPRNGAAGRASPSAPSLARTPNNPSPTGEELSSIKTLMIPAAYITGIAPGPQFRIAKGRKTVDVGVFPPDKPTPVNALGPSQVDAVISRFLVPTRN